ncbi:hypothetical protein AKJ16_DCAP13444 [Drosera capensis]
MEAFKERTRAAAVAESLGAFNGGGASADLEVLRFGGVVLCGELWFAAVWISIEFRLGRCCPVCPMLDRRTIVLGGQCGFVGSYGRVVSSSNSRSYDTPVKLWKTNMEMDPDSGIRQHMAFSG